MKRIAINGFGRIGRSFLRAALARAAAGDSFEIVGINDLAGIEQLTHLLKYDSTFGRLAHEVSIDGQDLLIDGKAISVTQTSDPQRLPWRHLGVDVVIEATGVMTDAALARKHLQAGARKVLISAPAKDEDITIVYGVNHKDYNPERHDVVSNASCTTNCLAPIAQVLHQSVGIESGIMTTVHAFTQDQNLQDGPHRDPRRARSAAVNLVPTTTGAAKAIGDVLPELAGRLDGYSVRVPVITGSLVDLVVRTCKPVNPQEINEAMQRAATGPLQGILHYTEAPLVSTDIIGNPASAVFDSLLTKVVGKQHLKIMAWYDNEWGFSSRLVDTAQLLASS